MTDPVVKVSGDAEFGFIVECHDGDRFEAYGLMVADEDAARIAATQRFNPPAPEESVQKKGKA